MKQEGKKNNSMTILPCYVAGFSSRKDLSWSIRLETNELPPLKLAELAKMQNKFGVIAFKEADLQPSEIAALDEIDVELPGGKTQSQRLRNVFYKLFLQDNGGYSDFKNYYQAKMEQIINHYKTKIKDD